MSNETASYVEGFVNSHVSLRSAFELERENYVGPERENNAAYLRFTIWYLLHGKRIYQTPIHLRQELKNEITRMDTYNCNVIMYSLAAENGLSLFGEQLRRWYYYKAVPKYKIAAYISQNELDVLGHNPVDLSQEHAFYAYGEISDQPPYNYAFAKALTKIASTDRGSQIQPTISIVGFHRSVLGIGEDARCLFDCICHLGLCPELVDVSPQGLERIDETDLYDPFEASRPTGSIIIFCLPVFEMVRAIARLNLTFDRSAQRVIGYWPWETTALPSRWHHVYDVVDEVWASSKFLQNVYSRDTTKPVVHVPLHVNVVEVINSDIVAELLEQAFTFLSIFDFNSRVEKKNPHGSVAAFRRAFPEGDEPVQLVFKTLHADHRPREFKALRQICGTDRRIIIIDGAMQKSEVYGLIAMADVYLSLHRSEGFGRPIAEAMLIGTPVVATGWSGCADFLTEATGYPVRSVLRLIELHEYPFAAGYWAEPDIEHAAEQIRKAYAERGSRLHLLLEAKRLIAREFGLEPVSKAVRARIYRQSASAQTMRTSPAGPV